MRQLQIKRQNSCLEMYSESNEDHIINSIGTDAFLHLGKPLIKYNKR